MNPILSPYALVMITAAIICLAIAVYVWPRRQSNSETVPLTLLLLGITEWIVAALLGLVDQNLTHKILWAKVEYIGVVSVPLAVLVYVLHHSGSNQQLTVKRLAWLALIPTATLILAWTNEIHGLIWAKYIPYQENGLVFSNKIYGLGFWILWVYNYFVLLTATVLSIRLSLESSRVFRWQSILIVIGIFMPWAGNLLYVLHINPFGNLDLTPLAFSITGITLAIGMFRWQLFDIKPVAQAAAIAGMADGLLILDNQNRILDVNPAAQVILGLDLQEMVGKRMEQIIPDWLPLKKRPDRTNGKSMELKLKGGMGNRDYEISDSPFYEKPGVPGGMIVFLHDTTNRKRLEEKLREMERKHAEALLQQAENKFATLYQNMSVGVIYRKADGKATDMNLAAERILGVGLAQINDLSSIRANLKMIREDGSDFPVEEIPGMVSLKTGKPLRNQLMGIYFQEEDDYHWIIVNTVPQFKPGEDKPYQVFVTFDDVTGLKQAEKKLEWQNQRLKILREIDVAILAADSVENIVDVALNHIRELVGCRRAGMALIDWEANEAEIFNVRTEGETSITKGSRVPLMLFQAMPQAMSKPLANNQPVVIPDLTELPDLPPLLQILSKEGLRSICVLPLFSRGSQIGTFNLLSEIPGFFDEESIGLGREVANQVAIAITQNRLLESLYESEEKYRAFFQNSMDAILLTIPDGSIQAANPAACKMLGHTETEICALGRAGVTDLADPRLGVLLEERARTGKAFGELNMLRSDGSPFPVEISSAIFRDRDGKEKTSMIIRDITERKQVDEALRESEQVARKMADSLRMVNQIGLKITSGLELEQLLLALYEECKQIGDINQFYVSLYNDTTEMISFPFNYENGEPVLIASRRNHTVFGMTEYILEHLQTLYISDTHELPSEGPLNSNPDDMTRSYIGVPLTIKDRVVGVLSMQSYAPNAYTPEQIRTLELLATQTAIAIQNAQLYQQAHQEINDRKRVEQALRQHLAELETLYESGLILSQITNPEEIAKRLIALMTEKLEWHHVTIRRYLPKDGSLELLAFSHPDITSEKKRRRVEKRFQSMITKIGEGLSGWVVQHGATVRSGNLSQDPRYLEVEPGLRSGLYVPMKIGDEIMGVISIESELPDAFTEADERMITTLAAQAAITLDNIRLFEDLMKSNDSLFQAYDDTIEGWSNALDLRDKETEGHTLRVTDLTEELAREMDFPETEIIHVRRGALLHDIGKLGVPDHILLKPDKLTDEEWAIMRAHPVHAYNLLSPIEFLHPALNIPHYHHERWDGAGYPEGLKGEQIPLEARIFAIIDVYDALTSDRPYRPGWPKERAISYIGEQSGSHFDPEVVEAFMELVGRN